MGSQETDGGDPVTIETYRPSSYSETKWRVISEVKLSGSFVPAEFEQVSSPEYQVDAMFADFSGASGSTIELSREAGDFDLQQVQDDDYDVDEASVSGGAKQGNYVSGEPIRLRSSESPDSDSGESDGVIGAASKAYDSAGRADHGASSLSEEVVEEHSTPNSQPNEAQLQELIQQAYEQGCADTRQEVSAIQRQLEERYRLLWEDMQIQLEETLRANEVKAVDLALQVAKRLVGDVVETQRGYILSVIQEALKLTTGVQVSSVRVSPQDFEFLKLEGYGDKSKAIAGEHVAFVSDDSIRAGCVLVTSAGEVDFDLGKAWERIRAKVLQEPES